MGVRREMCKFDKYVELFINKVKNNDWNSREEMLEELNTPNIKENVIDKLKISEYALIENILILKLGLNNKEFPFRYYLFKDKEFKFWILIFKQFEMSPRISKKLVNIVFKKLKFSIEEIERFKKYLGIYFEEKSLYFIIRGSIANNKSISAFSLESKYIEINYEIIEEKFIEHEEKIEKKAKEIEEKIKDKEKDLIAIIGAFVAIFTLISVNVTFLKESDGLANPLSKLITVNLIITLGMALLIFLVSPKIKNNYKFLFIVSYIIGMFVLFIVINYLKYLIFLF